MSKSKMELAVSTLFCLHKPFEDMLNEIVLSDNLCIELADEGLHTLTQQRVDKLLELKEVYGTRFSVHTSFADVNIAAISPELREATLRRHEASISWASLLEADVLVVHPGATSALERFYPGKAWRLNLDSIKRLAVQADEQGVAMMIENVPEPFPFLLKSVRDFERFYLESGLDVEMVLDVAHAHIRRETLRFLQRFGDRIGHIHVSDNGGSSDEHLQVGVGTIDWQNIIAVVKRLQFKGWMVIESYKGVEDSLKYLTQLLENT